MNNRQPQLDLSDPDGPPEPVVVEGHELRATIVRLREQGFYPWAMDVRGGTYTLHLRRERKTSFHANR